MITTSLILGAFFASFISSPFTAFYLFDTQYCQFISRRICFENFDHPICPLLAIIIPSLAIMAIAILFRKKHKKIILWTGLSLISGFIIGGFLFLKVS